MSRRTDDRWMMVRVPAELHARLVQLAADAQAAHVAGRIALPAEYVDRVPLHHVVSMLADHVAAKRTRSNRPRRSKAAGGVNTDPLGSTIDAQ